MTLEGSANCYGAITIMNAVLTGKGATLSTSLYTKARAEVKSLTGKWETFLNGNSYNSQLVVYSSLLAIRLAGEKERKFSGKIYLESNIPIGVGLKSSSSASIACILAILDALGFKRCNPSKILSACADASLLSGVSITGAYDDAASCLLGGLNVTDNKKRKIIFSQRVGRFSVVICIPKIRSKRFALLKSRNRHLSSVADSIYSLVVSRKFWQAMTLNGLLYSAIMGYKNSIAVDALALGALGSGLSGTGPAIASVFREEEKATSFASKYRELGFDVIQTTSNSRSALKN